MSRRTGPSARAAGQSRRSVLHIPPASSYYLLMNVTCSCSWQAMNLVQYVETRRRNVKWPESTISNYSITICSISRPPGTGRAAGAGGRILGRGIDGRDRVQRGSGVPLRRGSDRVIAKFNCEPERFIGALLYTATRPRRSVRREPPPFVSARSLWLMLLHAKAEPFKIAVPNGRLAGLRKRLARTRLPDRGSRQRLGIRNQSRLSFRRDRRAGRARGRYKGVLQGAALKL